MAAVAARKNAGSEWLSHLSNVDIADYATGAADADEKDVIERHIAACDECRERLKEALRRST